jgi:RHS repeat-associated protein
MSMISEMLSIKKSLGPFALPCSDVVDCNSSGKTLENPTMAKNYYIKANPDYPDAGGYPFVETRWKPDQAATKDVDGAPGKAYSLDGDVNGTHLVRAYSSGVNLTGINLLDSVSLNSVVSAVHHTRLWDGGANYHAASDLNPTHLWELSIDPDGRMAFTVKDGESKVIVSGALNSDGSLLSRSVNVLDVRGNVIKSHSPLSCEYTPLPSSCVSPSTFEYDSESRVVKSVEPDANETRSYYDVAGRVRATQTQRQMDSGAVSVTGYDHLDRPIFTGVWKMSLDSSTLRSYFNNVENRFNPTISELEAGTVTRTYYDRMPARDTLGVELYSADLDTAEAFKYNRGRVVATISDVVVKETGDTLRHSVANVYDKRGRVIESYIYNGSVSADSLKMVATATEYDLAGKILQVTKYPYGLSDAGKSRKVVERYSYDRLGRVDTLYVTNGASLETVLAAYEYYPTGSVKSIKMGNTITLDYEYHISGAVKSAVAYVLDGSVNGANSNTANLTLASSVPKVLYSETLYYEDCDSEGCTPQYNGNISRMVHWLAHGSPNYSESRDVAYAYDMLNRLTKVEDDVEDYFDEIFNYDAQGRIVQQRRGQNLLAMRYGGEYSYYTGSNQLEKVMGSMSIDDSGNKRDISAGNNFIYDRDGNMIEDKSKEMTISYDHRGLPVEFKREVPSISGVAGEKDSVRLTLAYDGAGSRITKKRERKVSGGEWTTELATHYTGIGSEIREDAINNATKVVVNLPQGLGRYDIASASEPSSSESSANDNAANSVPSFEWYLKNHLGSTMLVYGINGNDGSLKAAYDYRAFGEQVDLTHATDKVTETFTGKEKDDETELSYFGARYLDQMLGMWVSVDAKRQFNSPYLYAGNGTNPVNGVDPDGNILLYAPGSSPQFKAEFAKTISYLNNGGVSGPFARIHADKEKIVYIQETNGESQIVFDESKQTYVIEWNPNEGLVFPEGTQSPALGVLHEAFHAERLLADPEGFSRDKQTSDPIFQDLEEKRVIEGPEAKAAEKLGESRRFNYFDSDVAPVKSSTDLPE